MHSPKAAVVSAALSNILDRLRQSFCHGCKTTFTSDWALKVL